MSTADERSLRQLIVRLKEIETRLLAMEKNLRRISGLLQDAGLKLCHIIRQQREIFYKTGTGALED